MAKSYFEPQNLAALAEVFSEARRILERQNLHSTETMDDVARRMFDLASKGTPPWLILGEVLIRRQLEGSDSKAA